MLGRLGMSVDACTRAYRTLAEKAFTLKGWLQLPASPRGAYSASALEDAIKQVIQEQCQQEQCQPRQQKDPSKTKACVHINQLFRDTTCCKTFVTINCV